MSDPTPRRSFWKSFGPGLLWAGAAIGVSHLVQSTRAGASFGYGLLGIVILANVFKYPAFSFGPRYAAATGTSLLEGYRRRGTWALVLYSLLTLGTMFFIQAAVTVVTAALGSALVGWKKPWLGIAPVAWLTAALTAVCAGLLWIGHYRWLDKIIKVVVAVLTVSTVTATVLVLPEVDWGSFRLLPGGDLFGDPKTVLFMAALVGWMPSAFDISIWSSLWTLARRRETGHAPSVRDALTDFKIGYVGTAFLALCFVTLGCGVMFRSGQTFPDSAAGFAAQIINLYTENLGEWSRPLITLSAFTVMFSTTLTVVDGFPRAIATLIARYREPEAPGVPSEENRRIYWSSLLVLALGVTAIALLLLTTLTALVDLATVLSFLTAPALAFLNHRSMLGPEVPDAARPGKGMIAFSWAGIVFSLGFALFYGWVRLTG
jgi:Mn2+/Fe2+ NRAMP family transporter